MNAFLNGCRSVALLCLLPAAACGDRMLLQPGDGATGGDSSSLADGAAGGDGEATAPRASSYAGRYIVPPAREVSTSAVDELHWIVSGRQVVLAYNLPRILVGDRVRVALAGTLDTTNAVATLAGPAGSARCDVRPSDGALIRCDERFTSITPDLARVRDVALALDPENVDARVEVAQRFSTEPIGVLEVGAVIPDGIVACTATSAACPSGSVCHLEAGDLGVCAAPDA